MNVELETMLKMTASDPLYPAWDWLLTIRAAWLNGVAWDLASVPHAERAALVATLTEEAQEAWEEMVR